MQNSSDSSNASGQSGPSNPPSSVVELSLNQRDPSPEVGPSNGSSGPEDPPTSVVNFTGPRKQPTHLDYQELARFLERYVEMAKAGEIIGFGIVCATSNSLPITEATMLLDACEADLIAGLHLLATEMEVTVILRSNMENLGTNR